MKNTTIIARFKALALALLLSAAVLTCRSRAQTVNPEALKQSTPEHRAEWQSTMMKNELKLSDDQFKKVSTLNLEYARKMQSVIAGDGGKFAKAKKAKVLFREKEAKLKPLLSSEQFVLYQEKVKEKIAAAKEAYSNRNN